jgi:hypothetical protein
MCAKFTPILHNQSSRVTKFSSFNDKTWHDDSEYFTNKK